MYNNMYIYIYICFICLFSYLYAYKVAHLKSTPQKSSKLVSGISQWIFSGIFQRNFTFQWYVPKDCHFPCGLSL